MVPKFYEQTNDEASCRSTLNTLIVLLARVSASCNERGMEHDARMA